MLGESLRAVRFIPALASSLLVVQTALIARQFGARGFGVLLAAVCVALAPQYLSNASLLGTNSLEPTLWMGCAYFAIRAVKSDDPRNWLWFGIVAGIGLEEKYTIALFGAGIVIGLLLTAQRRHIASRWFWFGGIAALLIFLPNLWWNYANDWPFLQLMRAIRDEGRDVVLPFGAFFFQQTLVDRHARRADLVRRSRRAAVRETLRAVPFPRLELSGLLRRAVRDARQDLLPRRDLSDAVRRRRRVARKRAGKSAAAPALDRSAADRADDAERTVFRTDRRAGVFAGKLHRRTRTICRSSCR